VTLEPDDEPADDQANAQNPKMEGHNHD
jgi:hypothetical protein